jgi:hypothetical protein
VTSQQLEAMGRGEIPWSDNGTGTAIQTPDREERSRLHRERFYGEWRVRVISARYNGPDKVFEGRLRLAAADDSAVARYSRDPREGEGRLLSGWLVGFAMIQDWATSAAGSIRVERVAAESIRIEGVVERHDRLAIGRAFWSGGGAGMVVENVDGDSLRGAWHLADATRPPTLGWFCAHRLTASSDSARWRRMLVEYAVERVRPAKGGPEVEVVPMRGISPSPWLAAFIAEVQAEVAKRPLVRDTSAGYKPPLIPLTLEIGELGAPTPLNASPQFKTLARLPMSVSQCTWNGGYFGSFDDLVVYEFLEVWRIRDVDGGTFDGACGVRRLDAASPP